MKALVTYAALAMTLAACGDNNGTGTSGSFSRPEQFPPFPPLSGQLDRSKLTIKSAISVNLELNVARLPLFRGTFNGARVWFVRSDVSDSVTAATLGLNFAPRLANAGAPVCPACVQSVQTTNPMLGDAPVQFAGTVDFSPMRVLTPGSTGGADDFLTKPVEPDVLSARVAELLERRPNAAMSAKAALKGIVGRSAPMQAVFDAVRRVAPTDATVLVTGETGTGKELVARAVHDHSPRRSEPFVAVNCAALAEGLLESELFGHVRGAFTGAIADKRGLFEEAAGGTLFLDEIGDVSPTLQQRLLRATQEREVRRVGADRSTLVDVRIVVATSRDLRAEVSAGHFREDLFYRLNVFPIQLPPLRDRPGDIPLLVEAALAQARSGPGAKRELACSPFAMRMLRAYHWPGNVRELFAVVSGAAIRADGDRIEAQHLPAELRGTAGGEGERYQADESEQDERTAIVAALGEAQGNRARAAEMLGMGRTTLWRKMKGFGID